MNYPGKKINKKEQTMFLIVSCFLPKAKMMRSLNDLSNINAAFLCSS